MSFNGSDINATGLGTWLQDKVVTQVTISGMLLQVSRNAASQIRHKCHNFRTLFLVFQVQDISTTTERLDFQGKDLSYC